ncbi:hypothetical protein LCGC14_0363970 [marine sediment metagenome]|uniref:Uncharacterized protein n=1 Tax=marine sediment metagenome TaxID=412755 RepID=A0A0F9WFK2_9ZZZZ
MEYFKGDKIEYTGETQTLSGKLAYAFRYVEGHKIGQVGWTYTPANVPSAMSHLFVN